jgi:hypothetical protein
MPHTRSSWASFSRAVAHRSQALDQVSAIEQEERLSGAQSCSAGGQRAVCRICRFEADSCRSGTGSANGKLFRQHKFGPGHLTRVAAAASRLSALAAAGTPRPMSRQRAGRGWSHAASRTACRQHPHEDDARGTGPVSGRPRCSMTDGAASGSSRALALGRMIMGRRKKSSPSTDWCRHLRWPTIRRLTPPPRDRCIPGG